MPRGSSSDPKVVTGNRTEGAVSAGNVHQTILTAKDGITGNLQFIPLVPGQIPLQPWTIPVVIDVGEQTNVGPIVVGGAGTAGANAGGVLTVQGAAGGVGLPVSGSVSGTGNFSVVGTLPNNSVITSTLEGVLPALATPGLPSFTTGRIATLSEDLSGRLRVLIDAASTFGIGTADSLQSGGRVAGPAAGANISGNVTAAAKTYLVYVTLDVDGTVAIATDDANMGLFKNAASLVTLTYDATNLASVAFGPFRITTANLDTLSVRAIANATATANYMATIWATPVT